MQEKVLITPLTLSVTGLSGREKLATLWFDEVIFPYPNSLAGNLFEWDNVPKSIEKDFLKIWRSFEDYADVHRMSDTRRFKVEDAIPIIDKMLFDRDDPELYRGNSKIQMHRHGFDPWIHDSKMAEDLFASIALMDYFSHQDRCAMAPHRLEAKLLSGLRIDNSLSTIENHFECFQLIKDIKFPCLDDCPWEVIFELRENRFFPYFREFVKTISSATPHSEYSEIRKQLADYEQQCTNEILKAYEPKDMRSNVVSVLISTAVGQLGLSPVKQAKDAWKEHLKTKNFGAFYFLRNIQDRLG